MRLPNVMNKLDGFNLIAHKMFSSHPDDSYLSLVLVQRVRDGEKLDFVVWTYNSEFIGFGGGYYTNDIKEAFKNFNERGQL